MVVLLVLQLLMTALTYLILDSRSGALIFSGGSVGSTMEIFSPKIWLVVLFYLGTIFSLVFFWKNPKVLLLVGYLVFSGLWFFSGRTVGVHWTGEVTTGWFYLSVNKIVLWKESGNKCSEDVITCTNATEVFPYKILLTNSDVKEAFFVGPLIRKDLKEFFNQN